MKWVSQVLAVRKSPEEEELHRKEDELASLQDQVAQKELELLTLESEQQAFETEYISTVGRTFADLDGLVAQIAQLLASRRPADAKAREFAERAAERSARSSEAVADADPCLLDSDFSSTLKGVYREVAKRVHPDLADTAEDRAIREELMKAANSAYEFADLEGLRRILESWESRPEAVRGDSIAEQLVRVIRKIAQLSARLATIELEIDRLVTSEMYELRSAAADMGRPRADVFEEMATQVHHRISQIEDILSSIVDAHAKEYCHD